MDMSLPLIPAKRYFTIGEVAQLCCVKPHVLRYWEREVTQLRPMKRRGNRRYYQHHEVLMIRRIRDLLYDEGFTISGARNKLRDTSALLPAPEMLDGLDGLGGIDGIERMDGIAGLEVLELADDTVLPEWPDSVAPAAHLHGDRGCDVAALHKELCEIRALLAGED